MSVRALLLSLVLLVGAVPAGAVAAATEPVARDCPGADGRLATRGVTWAALTVRGLGCNEAARALRRARLTDGGQVRLRRWRCALTGLHDAGGTYRCRRGGRGMRFIVDG